MMWLSFVLMGWAALAAVFGVWLGTAASVAERRAQKSAPDLEMIGLDSQATWSDLGIPRTPALPRR